jgi:hypothetical protein
VRKKQTSAELRPSGSDNNAQKTWRKNRFLLKTGLLFPENIVFYIENV